MIKVLIADDSALVRKTLSEILKEDSEIGDVEISSKGDIALHKIKLFGPDVVLLDFAKKEVEGLETLMDIIKEWPVPIIIMVSEGFEGNSEMILEAMNIGAVDFIVKPLENLKSIKKDILLKIKTSALAKLHKFKKERKKEAIKKHKFISTRKKIVVIGSSTGGPQTLEALLTEIPKDIPAPILIVQHMPPIFTKSMADRLNSLCEIEVREAQEGDELKNGVALIAPGGHHMELKSKIIGFEGTISLNKHPPELGVRPNVNRLFKSVAPIFKENTIGIILTGMGMDGKEGCRTIKEFNGTVIAEAEESCIIFGMPKEVINAGLADEIVKLEEMPVSLIQLVEV